MNAASETPAPGSLAAPPSSSNSESQLRFFKTLSVVLIAIVVAGAAYGYYRQYRSQPITVLVDGAPVTTVRDSVTAGALIGGLPAKELGAAYSASNSPMVKESIQMQRVVSDTPVDTVESATAKLAAATHLTVMADVISVNGKPILALPDKETAQASLDAVRQYYISLPPSDSSVDQPSFKERVTIVRRRCSATICKQTPAEAAAVFLSVPPAKLYTVQRGETGWQIAHKFHMSFSNFIRANGRRDLNSLMPGDTVNVSATYPPITVIVHKVSTETEPILANAPAGMAGERRLTSIDTYVNGVKTGSSAPISVYTVRRASPLAEIN